MTNEKENKEVKKPIVKDNTHFLNVFAVYVITVVFLYLGAITFLKIPEPNIRFADTALGFLLGTVVALIVTWAFRSSKAQMEKESAERRINLIDEKGGKTDA